MIRYRYSKGKEHTRVCKVKNMKKEFITITRCGDAEEQVEYYSDMLSAIKAAINYYEHLSLEDKRRYFNDGYFYAIEVNNLLLEDYLNGDISIDEMMISNDCYCTFSVNKYINEEDIFFEEGF